MIIVGVCVGGDGQRYRTIAEPALKRVLEPQDLVLTRSGTSIAVVYNELIRVALDTPDCEALVLIHDDVELIDPHFRSKLLRAVEQERVAVVGVIGGRDLHGPWWWESREKFGHVLETTPFYRVGSRSADVDVVDGLFLGLSRLALQSVRFDETIAGFHGYDAGYCLAAKSMGMRVVVRSIDVYHRSRVKTDVADRTAFYAAETALRAKYKSHIRPLSLREKLPQYRGVAVKAHIGVRARLGVVKRAVLSRGSGSMVDEVGNESAAGKTLVQVPADQLCPACGGPTLDRPEGAFRGHVACVSCATLVTWPPPARDISTDRIWVESYAGERLALRDQWLGEARQRVNWMFNYLSSGSILEVGSATGEFLEVSEAWGFSSIGVEPSEWAAEVSRAHGADVLTGTADQWRIAFPDVRVDSCAAWHVVEHVADPHSFLEELRQVVRPGGFIFLETPNGGCGAARRLGLDWPHAEPDEHYFLITEQGVRKLAQRTDLVVVAVHEVPIEVYLDADAWFAARSEALGQGRGFPDPALLRVVLQVPEDSVTGHSIQ